MCWFRGFFSVKWLPEIVFILQHCKKALFTRCSENWKLKEPCKLSTEEASLQWPATLCWTSSRSSWLHHSLYWLLQETSMSSSSCQRMARKGTIHPYHVTAVQELIFISKLLCDLQLITVDIHWVSHIVLWLPPSLSFIHLFSFKDNLISQECKRYEIVLE
jgi:hypothetical protein